MLRPSRIRVVRNQRMSATISEKITGTGIPITLAAKKFTKSNEKPYTELASEITSVIPRKIALVPRVIMNGCSPVQLTRQPLIAPSAPPTSTPPISAARNGSIPANISLAVTIPESARIAPTERSIPATRIAKNSPMPISTVTELCTKIWVILLVVRKYSGDSEPKMATMIARIKKVPYLSQNSAKLNGFFSLASLFTLVVKPMP